MNPIDRAFAYHERTKHHLHRYARSLGFLDWASQPDPFRTYAGAPRVDLPLAGDAVEVAYDDLHRPGSVAAAPSSPEMLGALLELSLGLSAWKQHGSARWALRCNPSSGNLHPTEGYVLSASTPGVAPGLYHYVSRDHALERRSTLDDAGAAAVAAMLPRGALLVGLSSIHWREAWKYGERAFRYCQHDIGHAIAAVRYAAAAIGHHALLLDGLGDAQIAALLGLDRDAGGIAGEDREHPDCVLLVAPDPTCARDAAALCTEVDRVIHLVGEGQWAGLPNALSPSHEPWDVIDDVAEATHKPPTPLVIEPPDASLPPLALRPDTQAAAGVIRKRRSAVDFDEATSIAAATLYGMLDRLLPRPGVAPWDALPWAPMIHPVLFIHRVDGLAPGLYVLVRAAAAESRLRAAMHPELAWQSPAGCPPHLRFYRLTDADLRETAKIVSCHQDIAADGALSLGMVADFAGPMRARGAPFYRRLFWEAGVLGHALYLEAEAVTGEPQPVRATGIGCYFDDAFHDVCGLSGDAFQSLYHFTLGRPRDDTRVLTLPPYGHLARRG